MYRNNLKNILIERKISAKRLSEDTGISRQTISNIRDNEFHDISSNVLTILLQFFKIDYYDFGTIYDHDEYLQYELSKIGFNDNNLKRLNDIFMNYCKLDLKLSFNAYSNESCLNFSSSKHFRKLSLSGNIRINTTLYGLTFDIIDFDFWWKPSSDKDSFYDFYDLYKNMICGIEKYAQSLGFTYIVFNVINYTVQKNKIVLHPMKLDKKELKTFINRVDYSLRDNETLKRSVILERGYTPYISSELSKEIPYIREKKINNFASVNDKSSVFDKESIRIYNTQKLNFNDRHMYTKYFKTINNELVPKDRLLVERGF